MGARGPAPQAKLRMLHGETRPSHLPAPEPQPREALPECPAEASDAVREVWDHVVRELDSMQLAHAADRDALFVYCEAVVTHRRASEILKQSGLLIRGQRGNMVRNPLMSVQRDAASVIRSYAHEFGLTPASRARLETSKVVEPADTDNPFAGTG